MTFKEFKTNLKSGKVIKVYWLGAWENTTNPDDFFFLTNTPAGVMDSDDEGTFLYSIEEIWDVHSHMKDGMFVEETA